MCGRLVIIPLALALFMDMFFKSSRLAVLRAVVVALVSPQTAFH